MGDLMFEDEPEKPTKFSTLTLGKKGNRRRKQITILLSLLSPKGKPYKSAFKIDHSSKGMLGRRKHIEGHIVIHAVKLLF